MFCILATTFMTAQPARIEQLAPCYASYEQCIAAVPGVAHQFKPAVNTGMAFRCVREERAI